MVCFSARFPKEQEDDSETKTTDKIAFGIKYTNIRYYMFKVEHNIWWVVGHIAKLDLSE